MVTATAQAVEAESVGLSWDCFLEKCLGDTNYTPEQREAVLRINRTNLDTFRRVEWKQIVRKLDREYNWVIPEGLEPHWVYPGKAVYWQRQLRRAAVDKTDESGRPYRVMEEQDQGWEPTSPLPANNAGTISAYLRKGLRLRPPSDGEGVEAYVEAAALSQAPEESPKKEVQYLCNRHGYRAKGFTSWKLYVRHCSRFGESLQYDVPPEVIDQMTSSGFTYYCLLHNRGFKSKVAAGRHAKVEQRKPRAGQHATVDQMDMAQLYTPTQPVGG